MQTFLNDNQLKSAMLKELAKHRKADAIIKGTYSDNSTGKFRGCAVGCSVFSLNRVKHKDYQTNNHKAYEIELGIPEWLARLEDTIFERLPIKESKKWPEQFIKAIPVGVDLNPIKYKFCAFILKENIDRVLKLDISDNLKEQVVKAIRDVLAVHEKAIKTGKWSKSAARAAESAAWSAESAESAESAARAAESAAWSAESAESAAWSAESAAWSAAWSARSAAWSAARSAEWAARSAEWAAAESAAWSAESAESASYQKYAKELLRLIRELR